MTMDIRNDWLCISLSMGSDKYILRVPNSFVRFAHVAHMAHMAATITWLAID